MSDGCPDCGVDHISHDDATQIVLGLLAAEYRRDLRGIAAMLNPLKKRDLVIVLQHAIGTVAYLHTQSCNQVGVSPLEATEKAAVQHARMRSEEGNE